jgi:autotransporter strand-loop-strand O-heptosyltransferase
MATDDDTAASHDGAMAGGVPPDGSESASGSAGVNSAEKPAYPPPASLPTQLDDASGVRFDFNMGARVLLPHLLTDRWHIRLRDLDTGNILFESTNQGAFVASSKHFYVRFGIDLWRIDGADASTQVLAHEYDCRDRDVLIQFPVGTLGDILGWFPYAAAFAERHGAKVICAMSGLLIPLFRDAYPHIRFVTHEEQVEQNLTETAYATYYLGLFFEDGENIWQPTDFRHVGLHRTAGYILGVDPTETSPILSVPDEGRPIAEPYVVIAVQSSSACKKWNNPHGWREVITDLKARGYRVVCIDQKAEHGSGLVWTHMPHGVEDETGDRPLAERVRWLRHAAFFVGVSSGLSWLAWAAGTPVVMISGFTHPNNEFHSLYRIINWHACNSCWNDVRLSFDHKDYMWCPRHAGTDRQFECSRLITSVQVIQTIDRIPNILVRQVEA